MSRQKVDIEKEKMLKELAVKKNVASIRRMTQEELLEEAKITEMENMKSLGNTLYVRFTFILLIES